MNSCKQSLSEKLKIRAEIRKKIPHRKNVQKGIQDSLTTLLEECAALIELQEQSSLKPSIEDKVLDRLIAQLDQKANSRRQAVSLKSRENGEPDRILLLLQETKEYLLSMKA